MSISSILGIKKPVTPFPVAASGPAAAIAPESVPSVPTMADPSVAFAGANASRGAAYGGTIANVGGQSGLTKKASTANKTLLGE
jgi:hypothetical protein